MNRVPRILAAGIALASTSLSAVLGFLAAVLFVMVGPRHVTWIGLAVGAVSGALAATGWIGWMQRRNVGKRRASLVLRGVAGGVLAASLASVVVHAAIALVAPAPRWWVGQLVGQGFALVTGAVLGLVGGAGWNHTLPPRA